MHKGLYKDTNNNTVHYVVGAKNIVGGLDWMNPTDSTSAIVTWESCKKRYFLNNAYYDAHPDDFLVLLKEFKTATATQYNAETITTSIDKFALFAEKEVLGSQTYSTAAEVEALTQIDYYKTSANRIKKHPNNNNIGWWLRSPYRSSGRFFVLISADGTANDALANTAGSYGISPFCCI